MTESSLGVDCAAPVASAVVEMAHGAGGRKTHQLVDGVFRTAFAPSGSDAERLLDGTHHDSAVLRLGAGPIAFTTDAYVVTPRFFPGGDIGKLAAIGTMNDLAVVGAEPKALSVSFVLEEGLPLEELTRIAKSLADAARQAGVFVATGDTKVVEKGRGDGVYITTSGVGVRRTDALWSAQSIRPGDTVIVSGDLGRHGIAVLSAREELALEPAPESDCAPLWPAIQRLLPHASEVGCVRDLTRGGLGAALNELAKHAGVRIEIDESQIDVSEPVASACELLGLDPLFCANEGRFVAFVRPEAADAALNALAADPIANNARIVGTVAAAGAGSVVLRSALGTRRPLDWSSVEQLPRIC